MTETLPTDVQTSNPFHQSHHDSLHAFFDRIVDGVDFTSDTPNVTAGYITRRLDGPRGLWMGNGSDIFQLLPGSVNVMEFGADPIGAVDSAVHFREANDALAAIGGGVILVPNGDFLFGTGIAANVGNGVGLVLGDNVSIKGSGWGTLIIQGFDGATIATAGGAHGVTPNVSISDLQIDGDKASRTVVDAGNEGSQAGIILNQVDGAEIRHVWVHDTVQDGAYIVNSTTNFHLFNSQFINCGKTTTNGRGVAIGIHATHFSLTDILAIGSQTQGFLIQSEGGSDTWDFTLTGCKAYNNGQDGFFIGDNTTIDTPTSILVRDGIFVACQALNNGRDGFRLTSVAIPPGTGAAAVTQDILLIGCKAGGNAQNGFGTATGNGSLVQQCSIVGGLAHANTGAGINFDALSARRNSVFALHCRNNGGGPFADSGTGDAIALFTDQGGGDGTVILSSAQAVKLRGDTVAAGSLPAAGGGMDGRILIEDNGAGDRNLIVYAGGQRFRIDGGAAF